LEFVLSQSDALSRKDATERLLAAYESDSAIELGSVVGDQVHWRRSRFVRMGDPFVDPVLVVAPSGPRGAALLRVGGALLVYRHEGSGGIAFPTTVSELGFDDASLGAPIPTASLAPAGTVYRYQRRQAVRIRPREPLCVVMDARDPHEPLQGSRAIVEDISRSGAGLRREGFDEARMDEMAEGTVLRVSLPLEEDEEPLDVEAVIVRRRRDSGGGGPLRLGIRWRSLSGEQRTALSYYVSECERAMLRARQDLVEVRGEEGEEGRPKDVLGGARRLWWRRAAGPDRGPTRSRRRGFLAPPPPDGADEPGEGSDQ